MDQENKSTMYEISEQVWVNYSRILTSCRYGVASTKGVEHFIDSLNPDKNGVGENFQSNMWNMHKRSNAYLGCEIPIMNVDYVTYNPQK